MALPCWSLMVTIVVFLDEATSPMGGSFHPPLGCVISGMLVGQWARTRRTVDTSPQSGA